MKILHTMLQFAQLQINNSDICGTNGIPCGAVQGNTIQTALRIAFAIAGAVAVIIIIIAGLRYTISAGNPQEAAKAKNAILYAIVGVVVCVLGYAIVTFVLGRI